MGLAITDARALPLEVATETIAILARRGRGKTYTASVLAEELALASQPFVVLDPTGAWWGLRSSADGKAPGLEVTIIGGDHGDVPLEPTAGKLLASFVVDNPGAFVLDLSGFESNAAQDRFVTDFAERLYRAKNADRRPLTLIVDEADSFAPQRAMPGQQRMLGAFEAIVRRGRVRGLGVVLITQRPAVLNKNVLTQAGLLILLGITGPQDRSAVDEWVKGHATPEQRDAVLKSLAHLEVGEAWLWWPTEDLLERARIRRRRTFDSSATPKAGDPVAPVRFADVDLDSLKAAIADTIEKAKAEDPQLLRARIRELEAELRDRPTETVTVEVKTEVVPGELIAVVNRARGALLDSADNLVATSAALDEALTRWDRDDRQDVPRAGAAGGGARAVGDGPRPDRAAQRSDPPQRRDAGRAPIPRAEAAPGDLTLGKGERKVLAVLAQYPGGRTYNELAFLAGYSAKASTLGVILSKLRKLELIEQGNQPVQATDAGLAAAGGVQALPTGPALLDHWLAHPRMGEGERKVLLALADIYPDDPGHEALCELTGYSPVASTMGVILSKLRKLGLVEKGARRLAPEFADAIGAS